MSKPIDHSEASLMVLEAFNIRPGTATVTQQVDMIIGAALRLPPDTQIREHHLTGTREQFAARLASVRALFERVMVPK